MTKQTPPPPCSLSWVSIDWLSPFGIRCLCVWPFLSHAIVAERIRMNARDDGTFLPPNNHAHTFYVPFSICHLLWVQHCIWDMMMKKINCPFASYNFNLVLSSKPLILDNMAVSVGWWTDGLEHLNGTYSICLCWRISLPSPSPFVGKRLDWNSVLSFFLFRILKPSPIIKHFTSFSFFIWIVNHTCCYTYRDLHLLILLCFHMGVRIRARASK